MYTFIKVVRCNKAFKNDVKLNKINSTFHFFVLTSVIVLNLIFRHKTFNINFFNKHRFALPSLCKYEELKHLTIAISSLKGYTKPKAFIAAAGMKRLSLY